MQPFVPVVLSGDLATYTLARAFHEELGRRTVVVTRRVPGPVRGSAFIDQVTCPGMDDDEVLVATLHRIADDHPGHTVLLLGGIDIWVHRILCLRDRLDERFVLPYPDLALVEQVTDKVGFAELCEQVGVPHPRTAVIGPGEAAVPDGLTFPVVVKAADTVTFSGMSFPGKAKVSTVDDAPGLVALVRRLREAGYGGGLVVQERIPGNDQQMRVLTTYSDRSGTVRSACFGVVLLEDHNPTMLGNPVGIIGPAPPQAGEAAEAIEHATRLLEHVGWTGYANFDLKVDPRTGRGVFFELNPRLGRSHGYLPAAGHPVVAPYVREWVEGREPFEEPPRGGDDWLFAVVPVPLLRRYVTDEQARTRLREVRKHGRVRRPYRSPQDRSLARLRYRVETDLNHLRKFARHLPRASA